MQVLQVSKWGLRSDQPTESNGRTTFLIGIVLRRYPDISMTKHTGGSINSVFIGDRGTEFLSELADGLLDTNAYLPKPGKQAAKHL